MREYRDRVLRTIPAGEEMVRAYYRWAPLVIPFLEHNERMAMLVTTVIDTMIPVMDVQLCVRGSRSNQ